MIGLSSLKGDFMTSKNKFLAFATLALMLSACTAKKAADTAAKLTPLPPPNHRQNPSQPGQGQDLNQPANGQMRGQEFKPIVALITGSQGSDDQDYLHVYLTDSSGANPCDHIFSMDRFVMFLIDKANPVGKFNMSVRRGDTQGALFFNYAGGANQNDWVDTGYAEVKTFDSVNGADLVLNLDDGQGENLFGKIHAQICP
jgi:hypothetical protein